MTSAIINRIGRKVQMAMAGALIASSLAVAIPMTASAQTGGFCADYTGDGVVNTRDVVFVVRNYRQEKPDGSGIFTLGDVVVVVVQAVNHEVC